MEEKDKKEYVRESNALSRSRPQKNPRSRAGSRGTPRDSTMRSEGKAPARTYIIRVHEDATSPEVIAGTFSIYDISVLSLINPGSTHSYICMKLVSTTNMLVESTEFVVKVSNPLVNYGSKFIELRCENGDIIRVESSESDSLPILISFMTAEKYMRKGYEPYLAYLLNTQESGVKIDSVPVVYEYLDVFSKELSRLPPTREVEFGIELVPGTVPISIAPYRMDLTELKELKVHLQELIDKGFARLSYSPWGAPDKCFNLEIKWRDPAKHCKIED
ncbi:uncharacterized protein LOC108468776 [Gossypium arboreum]|uniref:uncharacterized protein LOC108468776 n=1 Tax=Gossypium arboreum TaxID=29729 RepID=UPI000818F208|nr:uncharacterized protein LOC108468776 [Gossypium arboreum]